MKKNQVSKLTFDGMDNLLKAFASTPNTGIYIVDKNRKITDWNHGAEQISGYKKEDVLGKDCADLLRVTCGENNICKDHCPMLRVFQDKESVACEKADVCFTHKDGQKIPTRSTVMPVLDENGELIGGIKIFMDVSAHLQREHQLEEKASVDALTKVFNRGAFDTLINKECERAHRYGTNLNLLFLDIDDFKHYNDSYGHDSGDLVLQTLGELLLANVRAADIVCRYGGEEFVIILPEITKQEAAHVAEKLCKKFKNIVFQPKNSKEEIHKTISIGIANYERCMKPSDLITLADKNMYRAKKSGKNKVCY